MGGTVRSRLVTLGFALLLAVGLVPTASQPRAAHADPADAALASPSVRNPVDEIYYFVLPDRFSNGDPANDTGNMRGGPLQNGFDPTNRGFFHGGDLAGLTQKLDYLEGLGVTAIWMGPVFKNRPVQGLGTPFVSAGYHGYWTTDFTRVDPHFGTNAQLRNLVDGAHADGLKLFFDIITNHTADVIDYREHVYDYVTKADEPYRDANGVPSRCWTNVLPARRTCCRSPGGRRICPTTSRGSGQPRAGPRTTTHACP